jgi:hypothetical protein
VFDADPKIVAHLRTNGALLQLCTLGGGRLDTGRSWRSEAYGEKREAGYVGVSLAGNGRQRVGTLLVPSSAQPYANPLGMTYDSGDYRKIMDRALDLADWKGFSKRRRQAKRDGVPKRWNTITRIAKSDFAVLPQGIKAWCAAH